MDDLNEAVVLGQEVLPLRPPGHSRRSSSLNSLAVDLSSRYKQLEGTLQVCLSRHSIVYNPAYHSAICIILKLLT